MKALEMIVQHAKQPSVYWLARLGEETNNGISVVGFLESFVGLGLACRRVDGLG